MNYRRENQKYFQQQRDDTEYTDRRIELTGDGTGAADPSAGLPSGFIWVHPAPGRAATRAIIGVQMYGYERIADKRVEVGKNRGGQTVAIKPAEDEQSAEIIRYLNSPEGQSNPYPHTLITGGRVVPVSGLTVHIEDLTYPGGLWTNNTLALTPTATADMQAWVMVGINNDTGVKTQQLGSNHTLADTPNISELVTLRAQYSGITWLWAFILANGATVVDNQTGVDLRYPAIEAVKHNYSASAAPTVDDDCTKGYARGSTWWYLTKVYQCKSSALGAAVWDIISSLVSPLTTKGDLHVFSTVDDRLAVGSDGQVPVADSTQAKGIKWVSPGGLTGVVTIARGTYAGRPGSGSNTGDTYYCTDAPYTFVWDGAAWKARWQDREVVEPNTYSWSWDNQGGASVVVNGLITLTASAVSGQNYRVYYHAAPSPPYTVTAIIRHSMYAVNNNGFGPCFRESGTGALHVFLFQYETGTLVIRSSTLTSPTSGETGVSNIVLAGEGTHNTPITTPLPLWLRIADDNTNRLMSYSVDEGATWFQFASMGRTTTLTANQVGFFVSAKSSAFAPSLTVISWVEG